MANTRQVLNYLSNSSRAAMRFGGEVLDDALKHFTANVQRTPYGRDVMASGTKYAQDVGASRVSQFIADVAGKGVTEGVRQKVWFGTNPFRVTAKALQKGAQNIGLQTPAAQAAAAAATGALYHTLTETSGPLNQGLRPKGWKAVAPVSKEEDPTGRTPRNLGEEAALRFLGGQKSQLLPYQEFVKERSDVLPSTLANYRRYMTQKPVPGERVRVDTDAGYFSALGGLVRGTSRGLHDPEIRVKGIPISANATLGTGAALGTMAAGIKYLDPRNTVWDEAAKDIGEKIAKETDMLRRYPVSNLGEDYIKEGTKISQEKIKDLTSLLGQAAKERTESLSGLGQQFQKLGAAKTPALIAGGVLAGIGTAAATRELFRRAEERRIKKEDPVEYLKYKHGDFVGAAQALDKPHARTWNELITDIR